MCIVAFQWQPQGAEPLRLIANRDEFYRRPTQPAHFWPEHKQLFAGKDLQAGGSWMGASVTGKFALITNFRAFPPQPAKFSRGQLITDYLTAAKDAASFTAGINDNDYDGFNLLLLDRHGLHYYSNRQQNKMTTLAPGIYGLCNHLLDTPWPKLTRLTQGFRRLEQRFDNQEYDEQQALQLLLDQTQAPIESLPQTGLSQPMEQLLSSIFIKSDEYGTRSSALIRLQHSGELSWLEQLHDNGGELRRHQLQLDWSN